MQDRPPPPPKPKNNKFSRETNVKQVPEKVFSMTVHDMTKVGLLGGPVCDNTCNTEYQKFPNSKSLIVKSTHTSAVLPITGYMVNKPTLITGPVHHGLITIKVKQKYK